jgi:predicted transcriptional regulator
MIPFTIPAYPKPLSISQARASLPPEEFRTRLRSHLKSNPNITLAQVAQQLGVTRQCVSQLVGKLNRPDVASPLFMRLSPKTEEARRKLTQLTTLVAQGLSAERAAAKLGISLNQAYCLGFKAKVCRVPHGDKRKECSCFRCRRVKGLVKTSRIRLTAVQRLEVEDWLSWSDPQDGSRLSHEVIARLVGVAQRPVSWIARGVSQ